MIIPNDDFASTRAQWLTFSRSEKTLFLKENLTRCIEDTVVNMKTIPDTGSVCMVCIVKALSDDPSAVNATDKLVKILNRFIGKT